MKYLFLTVTCLSFFSFAGAKDYLLYHNLINKAENYLVSDVADSVYAYYDKAFAEYDFIFAKDAYIAAQFAWAHKNKDKTIAYLLKGAGSGLRSACMESSSILTSFTNTPFYQEVYTGMRNANATFNASLDMEMRKDWAARMDELRFDLASDELGDFLSAITRNVADIKKLAAAGKFPGENMIGITEDCNTLSNHNVFYSLANYDCVITEMHDLLWTAVKSGQLHPREFATLWEWEYVRSANNGSLVNKKVLGYYIDHYVVLYLKDNSSVVTNRACKKDLKKILTFRLLLDVPDVPNAQINANRSKYYITSLELDEKKRELEATKGYKLFFENK